LNSRLSPKSAQGAFKEHAETIVGNCDSMLLLGGKERTTLKEISELIGKETIDLGNTSKNRGREKSHGVSHQKMGKELMTQDKLAVMQNSKCILQLCGECPFLSDKHDITRLSNFKYLSDGNQNFYLNCGKEIYTAHRVTIKQLTEINDVRAIGSELGENKFSNTMRWL